MVECDGACAEAVAAAAAVGTEDVEGVAMVIGWDWVKAGQARIKFRNSGSVILSSGFLTKILPRMLLRSSVMGRIVFRKSGLLQ
jgi:hypothetical protein